MNTQTENFENFLIFEIKQFQKFDYFMNLSIMEIWWFSKLENKKNFRDLQIEKLKKL